MKDPQLGARLKALVIEDESVVATYELIDPTQTRVAHSEGGTIRIPFATLDAIDGHLGGTGALSSAQRIDLAAKFIRPLFVCTFARVAPADSVERKDATVHAHGDVVDARKSVPVPSAGA